MHIMNIVMKYPPNTEIHCSLKPLLWIIEMNTGPVNCASQKFHLKTLPVDCFRGSTEWAKETISVTTEGGHRWTFTYQRTTTITNEWTTSITMSVIDRGACLLEDTPLRACEGRVCYTAAGRHLWLKHFAWGSFFFFFLNQAKLRTQQQTVYAEPAGWVIKTC